MRINKIPTAQEAEKIMEKENLFYELKYCSECIQMTNHLDGECQKCKNEINKNDWG